MSYDVLIKPIYCNPRSKIGLSLWRGAIGTCGRWSMLEIIDLVSEAYGLKVDDLRGSCRERHVAWPRQHAMWLMAQQDHLNLSMIGRFLGGRDHTTIWHGVKAHQKRWEEQTLDWAA